jgi:trimeric autotransporter adhesin
MHLRLHSGLVPALLLAGTLACPAQELSNIPRQDFWVTDGAVNAIAVTNDRVFIGGDFRYVGPYTGGGVPVDVNTMQPVAKYPKVNGSVHAVEPDGQGGWFIGGLFTTVGGRPRTNLAHITAAGEVNTNWVAHATGGSELGRVNKLALDGDTLYAAGEFTHLGGQPRQYVGALLSASGAVKDWAPQVSSNVLSLAVSPKAVYLGGKFRYVGESNRNYLAAIDKTTGQATSWDANADRFPHGYVTNGFMTAIATYENLVIVAGPFNGFFGRLYLKAIDEDTSFSAWAVGDSQQIFDLQVHQDRLYVVGAFYGIGGDGDGGGTVPRDRMAALDPTTGHVLDWFPKLQSSGGWVNTITFAGNTAYVGGEFHSPNPSAFDGPRTNANHIAAFDLTTGEEVGPRRPLNNGRINSLAAQWDKIFIGGGFDSLGGVSQQHLAELDRRDGALKPWNPGVNGRIKTLTLVEDRLLVGGNFTSLVGQPSWLLAALQLPDLELLPWSPHLATYEEYGTISLNALVVAGEDRLLLAGEFQEVAGQPRRNLALVNLTTGAALPWQADTDAPVETAVIAGGRVYIGGRFATVGGQPRPHLASVDLATAQVSDWNPAPDNWVTSFSANSSAIYSAGYFTTSSGATRTGYAAHDLASGALLAWNLEALQPVVFDSSVLSWEGAVFVTGSFGAYEGPLRPTLLRVDALNGAAADWNALPHVFSPQSGLLAVGNTLYLTNEKLFFAGISRKGLAVFEPPGFSRFTHMTPTEAGTRLRLTGDQGREFIIERTADFGGWSGVSTNVAWEGVLEVEDPATPNSSPVFYRARTGSTP